MNFSVLQQMEIIMWNLAETIINNPGPYTGMMNNLVLLLIGIELAVSCYFYMLRYSAEPDWVLRDLALRAVVIGFAFFVFTSYPTVVRPIFQGFQSAALEMPIENSPAQLTPTELFTAGSDLITKLSEHHLITGMMTGPLGLSITTSITIMCWIMLFVLTALFVIVKLEVAIVYIVGWLFCGFAVCRFTRGLTGSYLTYAVRVAVRLFLMLMIARLGYALLAGMLLDYQSNNWFINVVGSINPLSALGTAVSLVVLVILATSTYGIARQLTEKFNINIGPTKYLIEP